MGRAGFRAVVAMVVVPVVLGFLLHRFFVAWQTRADQAEEERVRALYQEIERKWPHRARSVIDDPVLGNPEAPVTMEVYSDFQCPYCVRFAQSTWAQILEEYVLPGKVRVVYKFLPLPFHPYARDAAKVAMCANYHGHFWTFHDQLYKHYRVLSQAKIEELAKKEGLTDQQLQACLDQDAQMEQKLEMIKRQAEQRGIGGTPSFWINGEVLRGAQPIDAFRRVIDSLLQSSGSRQ